MTENFFDTKEYKMLTKIHDRLKIKRSLKNASLYELYKIICIKLCDKKYQSIGQTKDGRSYRWLDRMSKDRLATKEFSQDDFSNLWFKYWPENGELDIQGFLNGLQTKQ
jgi:hypothetical protein